MPGDPVLMSHTSVPESDLPASVQRLERPEPLVRATSLAFLRFEKRDFGATAKFLADFGLETVSSSEDELILRGAGSAPCVYVAKRGSKTRFVGMAFVVPDDTDLNRLTKKSGARRLDPSEVPGGAEGIELIDPAGHALWLITNWKPVASRPVRGPFHDQANTPGRTIRVNATIRPPVEAATVMRLGHLVLQTANFPLMAEWYMRHLGLIPTDVQYLADGSPALTFFRLNLGDRQPIITVWCCWPASRKSSSIALMRWSTSMRSVRATSFSVPMDTATCGASAVTYSAASSSITGSIPTACNSSITPTATCSPRITNRATRRSSREAYGPGATMLPPRCAASPRCDC